MLTPPLPTANLAASTAVVTNEEPGKEVEVMNHATITDRRFRGDFILTNGIAPAGESFPESDVLHQFSSMVRSKGLATFSMSAAGRGSACFVWFLSVAVCSEAQ
jgi:hypothetical protein